MTKPRSCPSCGSITTRRSRRRHVEFLLIHMRPFRCDNCSRRFYSKLSSMERASDGGVQRTNTTI